MVKGPCYSIECEFHTKCAFTLGRKCEGHTMHRWWVFTPPVWCEFGGFSRYNFYSVGLVTQRVKLAVKFSRGSHNPFLAAVLYKSG